MATAEEDGMVAKSLEACIDTTEEEGWIEEDEAADLHAELRGLREAEDRAAALEAALGALVSDRWAGWHYDGDMEEYACFYCAARGEEQPGAGAPPHRDNCPLVAARHLLAAPRAAGAAQEGS